MSKIQSFIRGIKNMPALSTPTAILLGALIIGMSHIGYGFILRGENSVPSAYFAGKAIDQADYVEGSTETDVYVIEYSDPECPFCVAFYPNLKKVRDAYKNKVAFVYRHFPLTEIHPHAFDESKAILCAGTIGGSATFYEYMDKLYSYKSGNNQTQLPANGKEELAKGVGLDIARFTSCMNSKESASLINDSMGDGVQAGVEGTPTTFILKKTRKGLEIVATVVGARDEAYLQAAIEQALSK